LEYISAKHTTYEKLNQPSNDREWNFRKINWKDNVPSKLKYDNIYNDNSMQIFTHLIEYKIQSGSNQKIFINPTTEEIININAQIKKCWIFQPKFQKV